MTKMNLSEKNQTAIVSAAIVTIIIVGASTGLFAGYFMAHSGVSSNQDSSTSSLGTAIYHLDLAEIMDEYYNSSTGAQPIFYVVQNGSFISSANISIPSHTKVVLTITSYDMGNASVPGQFLNVTGVVGDQVEVINGMVASGANTSQKWSQYMSTFPASKVLHTFTILNGTSVLLNVPVIAGDMEVGTFYLNDTGTFSWQCEAACGTGASGWAGPMGTPGWMSGTVNVL